MYSKFLAFIIVTEIERGDVEVMETLATGVDGFTLFPFHVASE